MFRGEFVAVQLTEHQQLRSPIFRMGFFFQSKKCFLGCRHRKSTYSVSPFFLSPIQFKFIIFYIKSESLKWDIHSSSYHIIHIALWCRSETNSQKPTWKRFEPTTSWSWINAVNWFIMQCSQYIWYCWGWRGWRVNIATWMIQYCILPKVHSTNHRNC